MTINQKDMKSFIVKLTVLTLAVALIGWLVFSMFLPEYYLPVFPYLLAFFFIVTLSVHTYQLKLAKKDIGKFTRSNMLVTFFKLILYSVFAVVYIANDRENALTFVIALFLIYLVFSFIEVAEMSRISRNYKK